MKGSMHQEDNDVFASMCDVGVAVFDLVSDLAFDDGEASILSEPERRYGSRRVTGEPKAEQLTAKQQDTVNKASESRDDAFDETSTWTTRESMKTFQSGSVLVKSTAVLSANDKLSSNDHLRFSRGVRMGNAVKAKKFLEVRRQTKHQQQAGEEPPAAFQPSARKSKSKSKSGVSTKNKEKAKAKTDEIKVSTGEAGLVAAQSPFAEESKTRPSSSAVDGTIGTSEYVPESTGHEDLWIDAGEDRNDVTAKTGNLTKDYGNRQEIPGNDVHDDSITWRDAAPVENRDSHYYTTTSSAARGHTKREKVPAISRSDSLMKCQGIVGELASLWQKQSVKTSRKHRNHIHHASHEKRSATATQFDKYARGFTDLQKQESSSRSGSRVRSSQ